MFGRTEAENARLRSLALQLIDGCFPMSDVGATTRTLATAPVTTPALSASTSAVEAKAVTPTQPAAAASGGSIRVSATSSGSAKPAAAAAAKSEHKIPRQLASKAKGRWIVLLKNDDSCGLAPARLGAASASSTSGGPDFSLKCVAHRVSSFFRSFSDMSIGHVTSFAHKAFGAVIPEDKLSRVLNHQDVLRIERDEIMTIQLYDTKENEYNVKLVPPTKPAGAGAGAGVGTGAPPKSVTRPALPPHAAYSTVLDKLRDQQQQLQQQQQQAAAAADTAGDHPHQTPTYTTAAFAAQAGNQTVPWGVLDVNAPNSSRAKTAGKPVVISNVDVFVVDTGVFQGHPDLNLVESVNYSTDRTTTDLNGHGTHVAGTVGALDNTAGVVGVAPGVRVHSIKVLDHKGGGGMSNVLAGVDHIVMWKRKNPTAAVVANLSVGFYAGTTAYNAIDEAIERAISMGITFVIAAGNDGRDAAMSSPSHVRSAVTVGAYGQAAKLSNFSNRGSTLTINAPGENVLSTYKDNGYARLNGTSMATPHVTGLAALYLSKHPRATADQVKSGVIAMARAGLVKGTAPSGTTALAAYNRVYDV